MKKHYLILLGFVLIAGAVNTALAQAAAKATTPTPATAPKTVAPKVAKAPVVPAQPPIILRGDHCTARVAKDLVKQYEITKQGKITVQPFSTISGLDAVDSGSADIAASARPAMPGRAEEKSTNFIPLAWDAIVPITSPKNPVSNITLQQLHDIYLGKTTDWADLGGPAGPINLYAVAGPLDGVEYSLRLLIFHDGDQRIAAPRLYVNTEKLEEGIAIDPHGLGITTLSGVYATPGIKMLTVEGFSANSATIADGTYPLYSALYFGIRDDGHNHDAVQKFVTYASSDSAKAILRKRQLVPYADATALVDKQSDRVAWVNARVHPTMIVAIATAASDEQPNSAPRATAQALERVAPTSTRTLEAKDRAARADADKKTPDVSGH